MRILSFIVFKIFKNSSGVITFLWGSNVSKSLRTFSDSFIRLLNSGVSWYSLLKSVKVISCLLLGSKIKNSYNGLDHFQFEIYTWLNSSTDIFGKGSFEKSNILAKSARLIVSPLCSSIFLFKHRLAAFQRTLRMMTSERRST